MPTLPSYPAVRDAIYRAAANPSQWQEAIAIVAEHLGGIGGMLVYNAPAGQQSSILTSGLREDLSELYLKRHILNPWTKAVARQPLEKALHANAFSDRKALRRTEFDADILAPQAIEDILMTSHASLTRMGGIGGFGFPVSVRGAEDVRHSLLKLDRLQPHLTRALDVSLALSARQDPSQQLKGVLDMIPGGALLLGLHGQILHANPAAEEILTRNDGLSIELSDHARLKASWPEEDRALKQCIIGALSTARGEDALLGGPLRITRRTGPLPYFLLVTPLPPAEFEIWQLPSTARLLVLITDAAAPLSGSVQGLCLAFGLTAAETRVALSIGSGRSAPEAAAEIGVALSTVKTQLANVYEKLGVNSQVSLAGLPNAGRDNS